MYEKRLQVEVLLSTFVKVLHWMCNLFLILFPFFISIAVLLLFFIMSFCMIFK